MIATHLIMFFFNTLTKPAKGFSIILDTPLYSGKIKDTQISSSNIDDFNLFYSGIKDD